MLPLTDQQLSAGAAACLELQRTAQDIHSKRPFAALLLAPDNSTIVMSSLSLSHVRHAEAELARNAADNFAREYLAQSTLISTWEPCAMCAGTVYWANIGRLVYLASEKALQGIVGEGNPENLTLDLPCRTVFQSGQTEVEVIGPVSGWEEKVVADMRPNPHSSSLGDTTTIVIPKILLLSQSSYQALYGLVYLFNEAFPVVFGPGKGHGFNIGEQGLAFLCMAIGPIIAFCFYPLQERYYLRRVKESDGKGVPEARMWMARLGAIFIPISLFWFGWTSYRSVHWIVPIIASSFI
ncbi:uncharacterized protein Aud_008960 [Aspergillus udagawae]|uniref:CMP/dCMP-type deaminase domain-containing protein n=1 Tax=Aspergillus udagawae TaxID=91492 RepID=A0A8E0R054_9EURO|nr:uncharacterized protein Aud_008960 [Aspergillus udagawae]GIC92494.1 hypothetical protein Aud_008960 [Aspergillus udagawae]